MYILKNIPFRYLIIPISLLFFCSLVSAKKFSGYIITNNQDTLEGTIKAFLCKSSTGEIMINGVDLQAQFENVSIKQNGTKRYKTYLPGEILGFCFSYDNKYIQFHRFKIYTNSIIKNERSNYRFLLLVCKKNMSIFLNQKRIYNNKSFNSTPEALQYSYHLYKDYYLYSKNTGLQRFTNNNIIEFLKLYGIDDKFIDTYNGPLTLQNFGNIIEDFYKE